MGSTASRTLRRRKGVCEGLVPSAGGLAVCVARCIGIDRSRRRGSTKVSKGLNDVRAGMYSNAAEAGVDMVVCDDPRNGKRACGMHICTIEVARSNEGLTCCTDLCKLWVVMNVAENLCVVFRLS